MKLPDALKTQNMQNQATQNQEVDKTSNPRKEQNKRELQKETEDIQKKILHALFDKKIMAVLKLFLNSKEKQFYLKEISTLSSVPIATSHRILQKLVDSGIIIQVNIAKFKVYQLNNLKELNEQIALLESIMPKDKKIIDYIVAELKELEGIDMIILHGEATESKASIILIGDNINNDKVKHIASDFKQKHNFTVLEMIMTQEHFDHMKQSNLISGEINVIYSGKK